MAALARRIKTPPSPAKYVREISLFLQTNFSISSSIHEYIITATLIHANSKQEF